MTHLRTWVLRLRPPDELLRVFMLKLSFGALWRINLPFSLQPREWVTKLNQSRKLTMQVTSSHSLRRKGQVNVSNMHVHFVDTDQLQGLHIFQPICLENIHFVTKEIYPSSLTILLHG
jgi:hypothetical protein